MLDLLFTPKPATDALELVYTFITMSIAMGILVALGYWWQR